MKLPLARLLRPLLILFAVGCGPAMVGGLPEKSEKSESGSAVKSESKSDGKSDKAESSKDEKTAAHDEKEEEKGKEGEEPKVQGHVTVHAVPAKKRMFAVTVDGLGRTEPLPESIGAITAAVEGHVHKLLVKLGQSVTINQPILELDTTVIQTTLAEKKATQDSLEAALKLLQSMPRREECRAAELAVDQANVAIARAKAHVEGLQTLVPRKEASQRDLDDAQLALKQAELQRDTAKAQLKLLTLGPRDEAVAEAKTKIDIAKQAVANTQATLDLHQLRAPISGVVDSLTCHPGQTLTIGTPVGEIVDTKHVFVTVYFPTRSARDLRVGLPARIEIVDGSKRSAPEEKPDEKADEAKKDESKKEEPKKEDSKKEDAKKADENPDEFTGEVVFVGNVADAQTGSYPTRILVDNKAGRLRLGQVVKAIVTLRTEEAALAVPEAAIFDQGEGPLLAVVRGEKIKILHPEVGASDQGFVVVTKTDLKEGEMVVTEGAYNVPEDTDATIAPEEPAAAKEAGKSEPKENADEKPAAKEKEEAHPPAKKADTKPTKAGDTK